MNCFAAPVLRSADGAYLLGVMGAHTANAGQIYFPCGTPEPGDVVDGRVDLEHSARHELKDETGLDFEDLEPEAGWLSICLDTWANAWRDWGRPPAGVVNCFAAAVLRGSDGAFLLGVMGAHTANAGQIYFPCGTPEPTTSWSGESISRAACGAS